MRFDRLQQMGCLLFASLALNVALLTLRCTATRPELALDKQSVFAETQLRSARKRERPSLADALSKSDKTTRHGYDRVYTPLFEPLRAQPIRFVEIGVHEGKSMKAWQAFFSAGSHVFGIGYGNWQQDFNTKCHAAKETATLDLSSQCDLYRGDQSNITFLRAFLQDSGGRFDIVVDDGSHLPNHQRITFETLWPTVVSGGLYIIEDVETSYWASWAHIYGYSMKGQRSFVTHMQTVAHAINREFTHGRSPLPDLYSDVSTITFAQNLIVLRKQTAFEKGRYFNREYIGMHNLPPLPTQYWPLPTPTAKP
jgi:hypothetical protein